MDVDVKDVVVHDRVVVVLDSAAEVEVEVDVNGYEDHVNVDEE